MHLLVFRRRVPRGRRGRSVSLVVHELTRASDQTAKRRAGCNFSAESPRTWDVRRRVRRFVYTARDYARCFNRRAGGLFTRNFCQRSHPPLRHALSRLPSRVPRVRGRGSGAASNIYSPVISAGTRPPRLTRYRNTRGMRLRVKQDARILFIFSCLTPPSSPPSPPAEMQKFTSSIAVVHNFEIFQGRTDDS